MNRFIRLIILLLSITFLDSPILGQKHKDRELIGEYNRSIIDKTSESLILRKKNKFIYHIPSLNRLEKICGTWKIKKDSIKFSCSENIDEINLIKSKKTEFNTLVFEIKNSDNELMEGVCGTLINNSTKEQTKKGTNQNGTIEFEISKADTFRIILFKERYKLQNFSFNSSQNNSFEIIMLAERERLSPINEKYKHLFMNRSYFIDDRFSMYDFILDGDSIKFFKHK